MKINEIQLENFQGLAEFETKLGKTTEIHGDNAAGKSTVANAVTWLLYGKAANNEKGFSPKPLGNAGQEIHNLDTAVTAEIELDDGSIYQLRGS